MTKHYLLTFFVSLTVAVTPAFAAKAGAKNPDDKRKQAVVLNNRGVIAIQANDFGLAIKNLEAALRLDPTYKKSRDNLAIAYNNYGLEEIHNLSQAIDYFHKSLFLDPENTVVAANLKGALEKSGKKTTPESRLDLAHVANTKGDLVAAIIEYREALALSPKDQNIQKELKAAEAKLNSKSDPIWKVVFPADERSLYVEAMQRRIKLFWSPPKGTESRQIKVTFKVYRDGHIAFLKLKAPCDNQTANDAALAAVLKAAPFKPLPKGTPPDVDIDFTFDYNVFQNALICRQSQAKSLAREIEELEKSEGKDSDKIIPFLLLLAQMYAVDGKYSESEPLLTRALQMEEKVSGAASTSTAIIASELGQQYSLAGKYTEAEPLLKLALDIREKNLPANDPVVLTSLEAYAKLLYKTSHFYEANKIYERLRAAKSKQN